MDPLSVLRDFTMRNELDKIVRVNDEYRFDSACAFPCSMETAYRSKIGHLYTVETLVHFVKNLHIKHSDYVRSASLQKIPIVTLVDRKPLLDYLHGKISNTDAITPFDLNASVNDFDRQKDNSTEGNACEKPEEELVKKEEEQVLEEEDRLMSKL